jgi:hypothetical protein
VVSLSDMKKVMRDEYRFGGHKLYYEHRIFLLDYLPKGSIGAEIGVYAGKFAKKMIERVKPKELILIDSWQNDHIYTCFLQTYLHQLRSTNTKVLAIRKTIEQAYDDLDVRRNYFDWVYLDTDHKLESTRVQLRICRNIVKPGGLICGDDYDEKNWPAVVQALEEFVIEYGLISKTKNRQYWIKNE